MSYRIARPRFCTELFCRAAAVLGRQVGALLRPECDRGAAPQPQLTVFVYYQTWRPPLKFQWEAVNYPLGKRAAELGGHGRYVPNLVSIVLDSVVAREAPHLRHVENALPIPLARVAVCTLNRALA